MVLIVFWRFLDCFCYFIFLLEFFIIFVCFSVGMGFGEWMIDVGEVSEWGLIGIKKGLLESCMMLFFWLKRGGFVSKKVRGFINFIIDLNLNFYCLLVFY